MQAFHWRELVIAPESHNQHTPQALVTARGRLGRKSGVIQTLKILKNQMTPVSHHHPALVAGQALQEIVSFEILFPDFLSGDFFGGSVIIWEVTRDRLILRILLTLSYLGTAYCSFHPQELTDRPQ